VLGVLAILTSAIVRLTPYAVDAVRSGLTGPQIALSAAWVAFMVWSEGYRGFQQRFSPRVVVRALVLGAARPSGWTVIAPIVAMGLVHATRRRLIASWALTAMIIGFILLLRITPQPWRGIVDAGVVTGLAWGAVSVLVFWVRALAGSPPQADPEFPPPR
jgi:hypothetical protein